MLGDRGPGRTSAFALVKAALRKRMRSSKANPCPPLAATPRVGNRARIRWSRPNTGCHADCDFTGLRRWAHHGTREFLRLGHSRGFTQHVLHTHWQLAVHVPDLQFIRSRVPDFVKCQALGRNMSVMAHASIVSGRAALHQCASGE